MTKLELFAKRPSGGSFLGKMKELWPEGFSIERGRF